MIRAPWSPYDDGIVRGRLLRVSRPCDVCGEYTACVEVSGYEMPPTVPWVATIICLHGYEESRVAVYLGLGCGCLAKFHRQVAHIQDSIEGRT